MMVAFRIPLSTLEMRWAEAGFQRVHRSYLVSLAMVTGMRTTGGSALVRLRANGASPAVELPVSRRQVRELRDRLIRDPMRGYRSVRGDVPDTDYTVPLGSAKVTREGTDVTVIGYGLMASYALEAAELLEGEGTSVEVVDVRTLRPLDGETLLKSVAKTGKVVIAYEDNRFGGYGAEIAAIIAEEGFDYLDGPVVRVTGPDVPGVPYNHVLEDWFMPSPDRIADAVRRLAAY